MSIKSEEDLSNNPSELIDKLTNANMKTNNTNTVAWSQGYGEAIAPKTFLPRWLVYQKIHLHYTPEMIIAYTHLTVKSLRFLYCL